MQRSRRSFAPRQATKGADLQGFMGATDSNPWFAPAIEVRVRRRRGVVTAPHSRRRPPLFRTARPACESRPRWTGMGDLGGRSKTVKRCSRACASSRSRTWLRRSTRAALERASEAGLRSRPGLLAARVGPPRTPHPEDRDLVSVGKWRGQRRAQYEVRLEPPLVHEIAGRPRSHGHGRRVQMSSGSKL